ncbi:hypothetical protein KCU81_g1555, partial [Aureobasidium melanogenum]|uniref:Uncharacterized protein n=1 Tax=Aureobasidium melanogenum (strain CBS 110374) TaxID=1043003 RepID=A0A074W3A1_AURM1
MPTRYDTTPPWGKKRKREPSTSSNSTNKSIASPSPRHFEAQDNKGLSMDDHDPRQRQTPWAKHSDPLSPRSLISDHDELHQAAKDMLDWTRSDRPIEESLAHMERIVEVCQDEASWSGEKRWKQVIMAYKSCGASADAVQDLKDSREPFWTQCRVKHASATIATRRALADSIRTMVAESERANGYYLDTEVKDELIKAVERVFPRTEPKILIPDSPEQPVCHLSQRQKPVAPVARMLKIDTPPSHQTPIPAAPQQVALPATDPCLASRPPGWAPAAEKTRNDSLADSSSSRKSSAASQPAPSPDIEPSQVIKPKRSSRFAPRAAESNTHVNHVVPPSPSASPKPPALPLPIQFKIATGSNQPPMKRPRLDLDVNLPRKPINNVFSTPSSPEHRRSSGLNPNNQPLARRRSSVLSLRDQPPTGPRSLPLFQAKIVVPKEPLMNQARQKQYILEACDYNNIPAQDATPCSSDDATWILHFRDLIELQASLGKMTILHNISIPMLTYAPAQPFQVFGLVEKPSFMTSKIEVDIINTVARTFRHQKFILLRQRSSVARTNKKWLIVFEQPLDRDNFTLDMKINGFREKFDFFGLACSQEMEWCWVCKGHDHHVPNCEYVDAVELLHQDSQYLPTVPKLR